MTYTLIPNIWYTITPETDCDIDTPNGISIHLPAGIQYFHFADCVSIDISGTATVTQNPPLFKPASASAPGGGYIEGSLNVGHGAADAAAAQCTLTLGDLATGGTLTDSNGQSVELENPHKYATGTVSIPDATAAGTLAIGEWSMTWEAQPGSYAIGWFLPNQQAETQLGGTLNLMRGEEVIYSHEFAADEEGAPWTIDSVKAELEADENWPCTILDVVEEIDFQAPVPGASWNDVTLVLEGDLFDAGGGAPVYHGGMEGGGVGARTAVDVFNDIDTDADCPVGVSLDADETGLGFTAREYGENDEIAVTGSLFEDAVGMSGGHGDYSVAELITAIDDEFDDITPTAGETEGTITLTANEAGTDANAITYTATGCFGSGAVKQGSTTRGKNAVEQTAFKIYLNGAELDVEPAPTPEPLEEDTSMKNGHVYTVEADGAEMDFSDVTIADYATAKLRLDYDDATGLKWPSWIWMTDDGDPPSFDYFHRYQIVLENDGSKTIATPANAYVVHPEFEHEELTAQNRADTSLQLYLITSETNVSAGGYGEGEPGPQQAFDKTAHGKLFTGFNSYAGKGNLDGDTSWRPLETPSGEGFEGIAGWKAITFCTARSVSAHAFSAQAREYYETTAYAMVFEAQVGGEWVVLSRIIERPPSEFKDYVFKVDSPVAASKYRFLVGCSGSVNFRLQSVRIFEK